MSDTRKLIESVQKNLNEDDNVNVTKDMIKEIFMEGLKILNIDADLNKIKYEYYGKSSADAYLDISDKTGLTYSVFSITTRLYLNIYDNKAKLYVDMKKGFNVLKYLTVLHGIYKDGKWTFKSYR